MLSDEALKLAKGLSFPFMQLKAPATKSIFFAKSSETVSVLKNACGGRYNSNLPLQTCDLIPSFQTVLQLGPPFCPLENLRSYAVDIAR